jgi:hypothetical protein
MYLGMSKEYLLKTGVLSSSVRETDELCRTNLYCTPQGFLPHLSWAEAKSCPLRYSESSTVGGMAGVSANNHHGILINVPVPVTSFHFGNDRPILDIV